MGMRALVAVGWGGSARVRGRRARHTALVGAALVALVGACAGGEAGGSTTSPTSPSTESPSETASPSPTVEFMTPFVYYMVDTRAGLRLARELRDVEAGDQAKAAVEAMIAGAEDPDYVTTWNPDTEVLSVTRETDAIAVDLSEEARTANVGSPAAALMIQQLVYTVTGVVDDDAAVQLLIEGEPAGELWGAVVWDAPIARAEPLDTRVLVQIDEPREGATVTSPVTVAGDAAAFEANVPWRVLDAEGVELQAGFTMTSEGQTFAPFSFTLDLEPGLYTIEISEDDPSGGAAGPPMTDTRTVIVE